MRDRMSFGGSVLLILTMTSCAEQQADTYTLYRNSNLLETLRVHWATFDAKESDRSYNANNCAMAARLLNANMAASAQATNREPHRGVGFWCEPGPFRETGSVPGRFDAEYPTDTVELPASAPARQ